MKQGEEYIVENKERHEKSVFKIIVLEATKTTIYFQIEDGDRQRLLTGDFEKHYRIIEKIEKLTSKLNTELYGSTNDLQ